MSKYDYYDADTRSYRNWDMSNNCYCDATTTTDTYDGRLLERANPRFGWPSMPPDTVHYRFTERSKQDYLEKQTCPYCGCRYQHDGKPNCSQCGAPKRGGFDATPNSDT